MGPQQFVKLLMWNANKASAAIGADDSARRQKAMEKRDAWKGRLKSALSDIMYTTVFTVGISGIIDPNAVIYEPKQESTAADGSNSTTVSNSTMI